MKKIYQSPQTGNIMITETMMICNSEFLKQGGDTESAGVTEADSRRYNHQHMWDDEELEEEGF